jgi:hypothetical protein
MLLEQATGKYRTTLRSARQVLLGQAIIALVLGGMLSGEESFRILFRGKRGKRVTHSAVWARCR